MAGMARGSLVVGDGAGLGEVGVAEVHDDGRSAHLFVGGRMEPDSRPLSSTSPLWLKKYWTPGAGGEVGDEVELGPEAVEARAAGVVEDEFHERLVVAEVAHHVVIAGAQEAALVLGVVGEEAAALADEEDVREDVGEAGAKASSYWGRWPSGTMRSGSPMRDLIMRGRRRGRRIRGRGRGSGDGGEGERGVRGEAEGVAVKVAAAGGEGAQLPVHDGLRGGAEAGDEGGGELAGGAGAELLDPIAHGGALRAQGLVIVSAVGGGCGQGAPHGLQFEDGADFGLGDAFAEDAPDVGQVDFAQFGRGGEGVERGVGLAEGGAVFVAPGGGEVVGVVGGLAEVEVDDALDGVFFGGRFRRAWDARRVDAVGGEDGVVGHFAGGLEVFIEQGGRHSERLAGVVEALGVGGVEKFAGGAEVGAGEVADGVVVLGVAEAAGEDGAGVAGVFAGLVGRVGRG